METSECCLYRHLQIGPRPDNEKGNLTKLLAALKDGVDSVEVRQQLVETAESYTGTIRPKHLVSVLIRPSQQLGESWVRTIETLDRFALGPPFTPFGIHANRSNRASEYLSLWERFPQT